MTNNRKDPHEAGLRTVEKLNLTRGESEWYIVLYVIERPGSLRPFCLSGLWWIGVKKIEFLPRQVVKREKHIPAIILRDYPDLLPACFLFPTNLVLVSRQHSLKYTHSTISILDKTSNIASTSARNCIASASTSAICSLVG